VKDTGFSVIANGLNISVKTAFAQKRMKLISPGGTLEDNGLLFASNQLSNI
jgi:hypothetical protein